jgi:signal transduction histidine kinase
MFLSSRGALASTVEPVSPGPRRRFRIGAFSVIVAIAALAATAVAPVWMIATAILTYLLGVGTAILVRAARPRGGREDRELLARVGHELRTPLNAILGFAQLLEREQLTASQQEGLEQIVLGGRHLLEVIDELMNPEQPDTARRGLSLEPVEIKAQIAAVVSLCGPLAADKSLTVAVDSSQEPLWARADVHGLRRALLNLVSNAIKYNRPRGSVVIVARTDGPEKIRLEVTDTGIGMTEEQLGRLFQPFERLDANHRGIEGTGLGLVLSKALVEEMEGSIEVSSTPRSGSTFTVRLRRAPAAGSITGPSGAGSITIAAERAETLSGARA